jgi:hypothetical protein
VLADLRGVGLEAKRDKRFTKLRFVVAQNQHQVIFSEFPLLAFRVSINASSTTSSLLA